MERRGRLVQTQSGWKCSGCVFNSTLDLEVAQVVHKNFSPQCFSGSALDETRQAVSETGSVAGPRQLESDDAIALPAIRYGQHEPNSLIRPFAGAPYSQGASGVADLWPAQRLSNHSNDMVATETLHGMASANRQHPYSFPQPPGAPYSRGASSVVADLWTAKRLSNDAVATETLHGMASASWQHPYSFPQPPGRSEDEESVAFNHSRQLDSDDVVYQLDLQEERERSQTPDQQQIGSRIENAISIINRFQCIICFVKWRSTATTQCRHLICCSTCFEKHKQDCMLCREKVVTNFPVEFHSLNLLKSLQSTFPLTETIGKDVLQVYLDMGFSENKIRRAIRLIQHRNNSKALPDINSVKDFMTANPNPVPDEMELLLVNENVDDTVKNRLCNYLENINNCRLCGRNFPTICLMPCQHLALCRECCDKQPRPTKCPDCGKPIENQVVIFMP